ncbi:MAG: glucosaminidase domain-containing protein [Candidatus Eisenbacteria sp.]|nr:glucosaminidase domain-containing protein [Candidatus Eisenbacteria bacterium]
MEVPDFEAIRNIKERKRSFFDFMRPIVRAENARVWKKRRRMMDLYLEYLGGEGIAPADSIWTMNLAEEYGVRNFSVGSDKAWTTLRRRVDTIPLALALVQAANESGWGSSRFAREGNSLFGQWCHGPACGMVPEGRRQGETHKVARFPSVNQSVRSYIRNLNTHPAYREMRRLRLEQRCSGESPNPYLLASCLVSYSERGEKYLEDIRRMLLTNRPYMGLYRPDPPVVSKDSMDSSGIDEPSDVASGGTRGEGS